MSDNIGESPLGEDLSDSEPSRFDYLNMGICPDDQYPLGDDGACSACGEKFDPETAQKIDDDSDDLDIVSVPIRDIAPFIDVPMAQPEIPRCYAYHLSGSRCEGYAGHPGDHAVGLTWGDDECWTPGVTPITGTLGPAVPAFEPAPTAQPQAEPCVVCNHAEAYHGGDGCTRINDEGDPCGCYSFT